MFTYPDIYPRIFDNRIDGSLYKHCNYCNKCVKRKYIHCKKCFKCHLKERCCYIFKND
uniref:Uncharacterized protein n=1 Tax=Meloidogyne incognita TaxID=6306 RepID=A0A914LHT8_MELIC